MISLSRILLLASAAASVGAQVLPPEPHEPALELSRFLVSAHPYARSADQIAQATDIIGGLRLDQQQAATLGQLLAGEVGVSATAYGPGSSRPLIRGLGGARVAVLENGGGTLDASVLSPDHAVALDPLLIERVEVVRGPAALLHGGGAIGGLVNVVTHRIHTSLPDTALQGRVEGRLGDGDDERTAGLVLEGAAGALAWHVDAFRRRTDNVAIPGFAESDYLRALEAEEHEEDHDDHDEDEHDEEHHDEEEAFGHIPNTAVTSTGGAGGLSWIGAQGYVGLSYSGFDSRYGIPPGAHAHEHGHEDEHEEEHEDHEHEEEEHEHEHDEDTLVTVDLRQRRLELEGEWREPLAGVEALRFRFAHADYRHHELEDGAIGTTFTNRGYDGRIEAQHAAVGGWAGAIGVQATRSDFDAIGAEAFVPPTVTRTTALFAFEELQAGATLWQLGARWEHQDITVSDGSGRARDGDTFSVSAGWVRDLGDGWTLAVAAAQAQRLPVAQELYSDGPHIGTAAYELGDDTLGRETSRGLDLSLRRRAGRITGEATVFINAFDGFIYEDPTGAEEDGLPVYQFVQRDARLHGWELLTTAHLHETTESLLDFTVAVDTVRARNTSDDTNLPRTPPARFRAGLDWQAGGWRAGTEMSHAFDQERTAPGERSSAGYTLWSAYVGYRWVAGGVTWDALLRGANLGNAEARPHTSFLREVAPLPGRTVGLSLRMSF